MNRDEFKRVLIRGKDLSLRQWRLKERDLVCVSSCGLCTACGPDSCDVCPLKGGDVVFCCKEYMEWSKFHDDDDDYEGDDDYGNDIQIKEAAGKLADKIESLDIDSWVLGNKTTGNFKRTMSALDAVASHIKQKEA